ncbi:transposable element Tcb1 transposase [Trichonephila clavipes]|nr:transposable element Tcb1 transposase [Trichonephila clavipes]
MSPLDHVWDLVDRRFARDPHLAVSKDELLLRVQAIWNSLPQADIQNLFDSMPRRIAAIIAARRERVIPVVELLVVAVADNNIFPLFLRMVLAVEAAKFNAAPISD